MHRISLPRGLALGMLLVFSVVVFSGWLLVPTWLVVLIIFAAMAAILVAVVRSSKDDDNRPNDLTKRN